MSEEAVIHETTHSADETIALGERFAAMLGQNDIVLYDGDMGAGKTHFTKGIAKGLGCSETVTSPTYTIVNEYRGGKFPLFHFDLYRLSDEDDLFATGFYDYLGNGVVCVEWAERIDGLDEILKKYLPPRAVLWKVSISAVSPEERDISIHNCVRPLRELI